MTVMMQDILIIALAMWIPIESGGIAILTGFPAIVSIFAGLIMGNMHTALLIGGTFQLMNLGVSGFGGSSVPDYGLATIVSTFLAARTGASFATAMAVGLPVGMLAINLDVVVKLLNNFVAHRSQKYAHQGQFGKMKGIMWLGPLMAAMKQLIPMSIIVFFGPQAVKIVLNVIPKWVTTGLNIAGGILPVVGIALLLRYMPAKKYFSYLIAGFVLAAYLKVSILGIALLGFAAAYVIYQNGIKEANAKENATQNSKDVNIQQGDDYDE
ncbi:phosphoenolpyruvate-dependent sugar phosphotransferase system EIIC, probable sorbose specific [Pediococcus damnosus]|uniref:Phosphoenolpyruvate-dependent sugar phosphotransferase system EIIC, probable sorbose specific n=2 Tax=Pediococcus damnosus TaxID=51663 RepID=A0A143A7Y3_9LACO|nr:PTS sugar transporter subunit IIC [Pediococcus damnosus]AMV60367.1 phosphoenolpyruvate-dependent sugar phosphotransferase system EIIC, probable sorbose specific [Pediococcus damnosus]AMV63231.1 phosphoenolpyruvate-dependent sugar phosphotransferase system EIIC, probable sorbose specific [Pediococcus damnosus]AMV64617.1 phosphoenolpyruvate-dependent sugar phosphotransferase system EIIC, probable sorbose specific [Pediococcus damnosus]AMV66872.1 phosphoenolpyruvate-dependent sugar phosphotrans